MRHSVSAVGLRVRGWGIGLRWLALAVLVGVGGAGRDVGAASTPSGAGLPEYKAWREACRRLPTNRALGERLPPRELLPLKTFAEFRQVLDAVLESSRTGPLAQADRWSGEAPRAETFLNLDAAYFVQSDVPFQPFAQRYQVPPGTRAFFHGDLHGDIHSLLIYLDALNAAGHLDGFRVARPEVRLVFLGDYTDRGRYGVEVLYTLLRLKLANPDQVVLVRGNHEDLSLVSRYGFLAEATAKYGREFDARRVLRFYDFLPVVLYFTCGQNVVQGNHGGLEPGYDPRLLIGAPAKVEFQFLGRLEQRRWLVAPPAWVEALPAAARRQLQSYLSDFVPESPTTPSVLGFMWNDFTVVAGEPQFAVDPGRAFVYGDQAARQTLAAARAGGRQVRALFRAHQHASAPNPMMRRLMASHGIFRHWQAGDSLTRMEAEPDVLAKLLEVEPERSIPEGSVWTFNVVPDSVYGAGCGFTFDTAGEVTTAEAWADWRLRVMNFSVPVGP